MTDPATDPVTNKCRQVREEIVQRAGRFGRYFNQLEELDRQRLAAEVAKKSLSEKSEATANKRDRKRKA